jgi:glycyl-tRNA synthetase beta chain
VRERTLLIEVGVEELPHAGISDAAAQFAGGVLQRLDDAKIVHGTSRSFTTPRRLAVLVVGVAEKQEDYREEKRGPSCEKAYDGEGRPTRALRGFLDGNNVGIEETIERETGNGRYVYLVKEVEGKPTGEILPGILEDTLRSMSFPKTMRWEQSGYAFPRPIRWMVVLFGKDVLPLRVADVDSAGWTRGHRAYAPERIEVESPEEYEETLRRARVIADFEVRRGEIEAQTARITEGEGLTPSSDASGLFDENAHLTEYPHAVLCSFDESFLALPEEVLTSEMIEHQHYIPLVHRASGALSNRFIAVSNIEDNEETRRGYERVLKARLEDGAFFFKEDRKADFGSLTGKLERVLFHEKLGTMLEKVQRVRRIAGTIGRRLSLGKAVLGRIDRVALICKNDLTTLMVGEFPHLQGVIGSYYARAAGYDEAVAAGVREHYLPRYAQDAIPEGIEGCVVGIADRLDTIFGMFSIDLKPKGSKDPFALRRQVLAIIRIVLHHELHLSLADLFAEILPLYGGAKEGMRGGIEEFFVTRIKTIFFDMGFSYDEIDASLSGLLDDVYDTYRKVAALHALRGDADFNDLLVSFRRMSNIVMDRKASGAESRSPRARIDESLLKEEQEKTLFGHFEKVRGTILSHIDARNYTEVYRILSTFKPHVDSFFDHVLVMEEDETLRRNRLSLLTVIIDTFSGIIDFSKIVTPGD